VTARFPDLQLSVVLPGYNEAHSIEQTVRRAVASLERMVGGFEIVIVDDCSKDETGAIADRLAAELTGVRVLHNQRNLGQGGSLHRGFAATRFPWVTHNAVDYPFDFDDLPLLLAKLPAADVVVAARDAYPGITRSRLWASNVNRFLLRTLFGTQVHDYNFIQIYRRELVQDPRAFSNATAFITPELIIRAHQAGYTVVEVPAHYHERKAGRSTSLSWKNVRQALRDMGRLWLDLRHPSRPQPRGGDAGEDQERQTQR
jgi:glycosyltransferase involved in cell wall biosynthesis